MRILPRHILPRDWPIAWRITSGLLIAAIVPIAVVAFLGARNGSSALRTAAFRNLRLTARITSTRIDQFLMDHQRLLGIVRRWPSATDFFKENTQAAMLATQDLQRGAAIILDADKTVASVQLVDLKGVIRFSSTAASLGKNVGTRRYWKAASEGREFISTLLVGKNTGEPGVYLSGPVRSPNQQVVGVAIIKLDGRVIREIVSSVQLGAEGGAILVDENDVILASRKPELNYCSTRPLTPEEVKRASPKQRWGIQTIRPAPMAHAQFVETEEDDPDAPERTWQAFYENRMWFAGSAPLAHLPWRVLAFEPEEQLDAPLRTLLWQQLTAIGLVVVFTIVFVISHSRSILQPVRDLSATAQKIAAGDLSARAVVTSDDELGALARAFNAMVPELQASLQMRGALALAHEVQRNLLPAGPPEFPGLDVAGISISADQTGGDYFDFFDLRPFGDDRLAIAIGDVVGHGIAAALLMAGARANIRSRARPLGDLDALIEGVNRLIHEDVSEGQFMTLLFLVFDPRTSCARWIDAGHASPLHFHADSLEVSETKSQDIPLGILPDWSYHTTTDVHLSVGDVLLLCTDGVWEARNPDDELFGHDRVTALLQKHHALSSREIIARIREDLDAFQAGHPFGDDVTIVILKRTDI